MDMHKLLIATLSIIIGFPAFIGVMSFITWDNGFKMLGWKYMVRMTFVLCAGVWIFAFVARG